MLYDQENLQPNVILLVPSLLGAFSAKVSIMFCRGLSLFISADDLSLPWATIRLHPIFALINALSSHVSKAPKASKEP